MSPQTPLFSPITRQVNGYRQNTSNAMRPLMYPDEIEHMDNRECLIMVRGQKPLKAMKIIPDELSDYHNLKRTKVTEYIPKWRYDEENNITEPETDISEEYTEKSKKYAPSEMRIIMPKLDKHQDIEMQPKHDPVSEVDFDPPLTAKNIIEKIDNR
jgi:type IV secretion system protein VirD4